MLIHYKSSDLKYISHATYKITSYIGDEHYTVSQSDQHQVVLWVITQIQVKYRIQSERYLEEHSSLQTYSLTYFGTVLIVLVLEQNTKQDNLFCTTLARDTTQPTLGRRFVTELVTAYFRIRFILYLLASIYLYLLWLHDYLFTDQMRFYLWLNLRHFESIEILIYWVSWRLEDGKVPSAFTWLG